MKNAFLCLGFVCCTIFASTANAGPIGPVFPPPNGDTLVTSGLGIGFSGGKTFNFSALNVGSYSDLFWGPTSLLNGYNAGSKTQTLSSFTTSEAIYTGSTTLDGAFGFSTLATRTIVDLSGATFGLPPAGTLGSTGVLAAVTGDFSAQVQMEVLWNGAAPPGFNNPAPGWYATNDLYNVLNTEFAGTTTSFSGGFWYDAAAQTAVPVPPTLALAGMALVSLGTYAVRRRRQNTAIPSPA
jgi:hypothetical protein